MSGGDVDVFARLSKLIEAHVPDAAGGRVDEAALDRLISSYIDDSRDGHHAGGRGASGAAATSGSSSSAAAGATKGPASGAKPTPFETWKARQNNTPVNFRQPKKLNEQQWDKLIGKMQKHNKLSQRSAVRDQNLGFAEELSGHDFKPKINKTSLNLSKTMKSIHIRLPEMLAEKRHELEKKKEESDKREVAECTFAPTLVQSKYSGKYTKKLERSKFLPDDLIKFRDEVEKRRESRRQIMEELESKELTFKPQINAKSQEIQSKFMQMNENLADPMLRFSALQQRSSFRVQSLDLSLDISKDDGLVPGAPIVVESDHPYKHNVSEYTKIKVPGAVRYVITFDEQTRTEHINDYIKFYRDDSHTGFWGSAKYCGGSANTLMNWPGTQDRPPLVIKDSMFVIYFKTNGTVNDWGYKMTITPYFHNVGEKPQFSSTDFKVNIDSPYRPNRRPSSSPIHDRLYQQGMEAKIEQHNNMVDLIQSKLNVPFRAWETVRSSKAGENQNRYSSQKNMKTASVIEGNKVVTVVNSDQPHVNVVEFDDSVAFLWKTLRTATPQQL